MGLLALLPAFLIVAHTQDKISVYNPVHVKAALLAKRFDPQLLAGTNVHIAHTESEFLTIEGQAIWFDGDHNKVKFRGPEGSNYLQYLEVFDFAPKTVALHIEIRNETLGLQSTTDTKLPNNTTAAAGNSEVGLNLQIRPRINDDGTITVLISSGKDGSKPGTSWTYRLAPGKPGVLNNLKTLGEGSAAVENCSVTISAKIVD